MIIAVSSMTASIAIMYGSMFAIIEISRAVSAMTETVYAMTEF